MQDLGFETGEGTDGNNLLPRAIFEELAAF